MTVMVSGFIQGQGKVQSHQMGSFLLRISSKDSDSGYVLCGGKNTESRGMWDYAAAFVKGRFKKKRGTSMSKVI